MYEDASPRAALRIHSLLLLSGICCTSRKGRLVWKRVMTNCVGWKSHWAQAAQQVAADPCLSLRKARLGVRLSNEKRNPSEMNFQATSRAGEYRGCSRAREVGHFLARPKSAQQQRVFRISVCPCTFFVRASSFWSHHIPQTVGSNPRNPDPHFFAMYVGSLYFLYPLIFVEPVVVVVASRRLSSAINLLLMIINVLLYEQCYGIGELVGKTLCAFSFLKSSTVHMSRMSLMVFWRS